MLKYVIVRRDFFVTQLALLLLTIYSGRAWNYNIIVRVIVRTIVAWLEAC